MSSSCVRLVRVKQRVAHANPLLPNDTAFWPLSQPRGSHHYVPGSVEDEVAASYTSVNDSVGTTTLAPESVR